MKCPHCPVAADTACPGETWHTGLCALAAAGPPGARDLIRYRAAQPAVPPPRAEPPLPSAPVMAANLARAAAAHLAAGLAHADPATAAARLAVCGGCDRWRPSDRRCAACGCYVDSKVRLAAARCPLGKW